MFFSPPTTVVIQGNSQHAANLSVLSIGGRQTNSQWAANYASIKHIGVIKG